MISDEYAAGFFDGEGTVYAASRSKPDVSGKSRPSPTIMVCIANTVRDPLDMLCEKWGGSIHAQKVTKANRRQCFQWTVAARQAAPFLRAIFPHLIIKKGVVGHAIEFRDLMATPHKERVDYSNRVFRNGRFWSSPIVRPEFRAKIEGLHALIRLANYKTQNRTRRYTLEPVILDPIKVL